MARDARASTSDGDIRWGESAPMSGSAATLYLEEGTEQDRHDAPWEERENRIMPLEREKKKRVFLLVVKTMMMFRGTENRLLPSVVNIR